MNEMFVTKHPLQICQLQKNYQLKYELMEAKVHFTVIICSNRCNNHFILVEWKQHIKI